jgi:hypothetical protein
MIEDTVSTIRKDVETTMAKKNFELTAFLNQLSARMLVLAQRYGAVGRKLFSILATGSIAFSRSGLDMSQVGGFSIICGVLFYSSYFYYDFWCDLGKGGCRFFIRGISVRPYRTT